MRAPCWRCGRGFELDSTPVPPSWTVYGPWHRQPVDRVMLCGPCRSAAAEAARLDVAAAALSQTPIRVTAVVGR